MIRGEDSDYFRMRALQEQVAAAKATCDEARSRHDELAMLYRFKAAMLSRGPEKWSDSLVPEDQSENV